MEDDIEQDLAQEEDDGGVMPAQAILNFIQEAAINEKLCPELLPHKAELIEIMLDQVKQMKININHLDPTDLMSLIHRQELERIEYLLRSYLRTRLNKIEQFSLWLTKNSYVLSADEIQYMQEYLTATVRPLKALCEQMPETIGSLNAQQLETVPVFNTHVFIRSKETLRDAIIIQKGNSEEEVTVKRGSCYVFPYSIVRDQVKNSIMTLI